MSRCVKILTTTLVLVALAVGVLWQSRRPARPRDLEVERHPEEVTDAEARRLAEQSVTVLPPKTFRTLDLDERTIRSLPGMSEEQRAKVWERVKAVQERMRKEETR